MPIYQLKNIYIDALRWDGTRPGKERVEQWLRGNGIRGRVVESPAGSEPTLRVWRSSGEREVLLMSGSYIIFDPTTGRDPLYSLFPGEFAKRFVQVPVALSAEVGAGLDQLSRLRLGLCDVYSGVVDVRFVPRPAECAGSALRVAWCLEVEVQSTYPASDDTGLLADALSMAGVVGLYPAHVEVVRSATPSESAES